MRVIERVFFTQTNRFMLWKILVLKYVRLFIKNG